MRLIMVSSLLEIPAGLDRKKHWSIMNCLYMSLKQLGELLCSVLKVVDMLLLSMFCFETIEDTNDSELFDYPLDF